MTDREKYIWDTMGVLIVRDFLTQDEVARLNEAFDANQHLRGEDGNSFTGGSSALTGERKRGIFTGMLAWDKPWCDPFRELLCHQKSIPYLNAMLGRGWRMDHDPFMLCGGAGAEGLVLHGPGHHFDGAQYYAYKNGIMRAGMIVFQFQLADVLENQGGFCYVPGSHKANFPLPQSLRNMESDRDLIVNPGCKAGDLLIFNEATTHGTCAWTAPHERRSLLYRYSPKYLHFAGGVYGHTYPAWTEELTEAQRAVLEPPYIYHHPLIEDDGVTVVRPLREDHSPADR